MAIYNKFQGFVEDLNLGVHDFAASGDTLKIYLSNTAPNAATHLIKADLPEITPGNGYVAGGEDIQNDLSRTSGTAAVTGQDVTWTASGGSIGPFRYVVLYNETASQKPEPLIAWWDYGTSITLQNGETFLVDFGSTVFTLS